MDRQSLYQLIAVGVVVFWGLVGCSPQPAPPTPEMVPTQSVPAKVVENPLMDSSPQRGDTFSIQFNDEILPEQFSGSVVEVDLFDTDPEMVKQLHQKGKIVICYISAGSWEDWRPDAENYPSAILGKRYAGWPGERWVDIRQIEELSPILSARLDLCAEKGFDGVEMDNVDGFQNQTGFDLNAEDQLTFNRWLAKEAHSRGLSIGLKNDPDQIPDLINDFDWALSEDCFMQNWCGQYQPFLDQGKAVFALEYTDENPDMEKICREAQTLGIFVLLKNRELDEFEEFCP